MQQPFYQGQPQQPSYTQYPQPQQPYGQQPYYPPQQPYIQPPPVPPKKKPWFRRPLGIGCGILLGVLLLCGIIGAIGNATHGTSPTAIAPTNTPTPTATMQAVVQPTDTPTPIPTVAPTDTPTPTPTLQSTPTPTPTPQPTQAVVQPTPHPTQPAPYPTPTPTQPAPHPTPTPTHCIAVNNNPWCYNFVPGNLIYNPPSTFCAYFTCVSTFWTANHGYVAECGNGSYTHSGGVTGACSRDGGVAHTLYSH